MLNSVFCVINTSHHALATMFLAVLGQTIVQTVMGTDRAHMQLSHFEYQPLFERSDPRRLWCLFEAQRLIVFPSPTPGVYSRPGV